MYYTYRLSFANCTHPKVVSIPGRNFIFKQAHYSLFSKHIFCKEQGPVLLIVLK
uniref:Uncharacterized protein n=1 Tax=Arundo donax TaxID=35708 RepID=A0A0A9FXW2_ARUDO